MTYIMLTDDMRLVVTKKDAIYRGDNMNNAIVFLLPLTIGEIPMTDITVFLSYIRPNGSADIVLLEREPIMYDNAHYKFTLPVSCKLSRYPGDIVMWLQFMDGDTRCPVISKSGECTISILKSKSLDNCLSDHQLTAIYQLKKQVEDTSDDCYWSDMSADIDDDTEADVMNISHWEDM